MRLDWRFLIKIDVVDTNKKIISVFEEVTSCIHCVFSNIIQHEQYLKKKSTTVSAIFSVYIIVKHGNYVVNYGFTHYFSCLDLVRFTKYT